VIHVSCIRENGTLLCTHQANKKRRSALIAADLVAPLHLVVETHEEDGVVLEALALVHGHQWHLLDALELIDTSSQVVAASAHSCM